MKQDDFEIKGTALVRYLGNAETVIVPDGITSLEPTAFRHNQHIVHVKLPDTLEEIKFRAFESCEKLQSVNIPPKIDRLEFNTFSGCKSLKKITLPEGLTELGFEVFSGCESLDEVNLPKSILTIGWNTFHDTPFLQNIGSFLIAGDDILFGYYGTEQTIFIPQGVKQLSHSIFSGCQIQPKSIHIPETVNQIGFGAFEHCKHIEKFCVSENNTCYCSMDSCLYSKDKKILYYYASKVQELIFRIPDCVENFMPYAFQHTLPPKTIIIPKTANVMRGYYSLISEGTILFEGRHHDYCIPIKETFWSLRSVIDCLDNPCRKNLQKIDDYHYSMSLAIMLCREDPNHFEALGIRKFVDGFIHNLKNMDRPEFSKDETSYHWLVEILLQMIDTEMLNEWRFQRILEIALAKMKTVNEFAFLIAPLLEYKKQHFGYASIEEHFTL